MSDSDRFEDTVTNLLKLPHKPPYTTRTIRHTYVR